MTTTSVPGEQPGTAMTAEAYGALRTSAALWVGTSVLITNQFGQVLVQHVDYRDTCLLAGGAVDKGESPARAATRELVEELGVTATVDRCLAVDWVSADSSGAPAAMRFPGEILHVFDGGVWDDDRIGEIRLPPSEITGIEFVEPARLPDLLSPSDARRALSALRARINGSGAALLEDGHPTAPTTLDRLEVLRTPRKPQRWPWQAASVPSGLPVRQSWGWLFAPDGRVLVLIGQDTGSGCLPGGTLEPGDHNDPAAALRREAYEEAQVLISDPLHLGYLYDASGPQARVRLYARLTHSRPVARDPATGQTYARVLATAEQAAELFDWGPDGAHQIRAVHAARARLGLPNPQRQTVTELPAQGSIF
ncbi:NUDIX hydrolase [Streptomyces sp. NPDC088124]|uniref:NUDIX hydrolase n=1 Tax=Streptomyces sp. NPDC088124 TaxID=3154654 RepID=UPI0034372CA8